MSDERSPDHMQCLNCGEYVQYPERGYCESCGATVDDGTPDEGGDTPAQ